LGGKLGEKFHQFTSQGTEKMGESIGEVIGYFIPDLLLVVFSEGISELIEGALKAVRVVLEGTEIGKLALEAVRVADVAVDALRVFVEKADIFLDTKYAELKEELLKIIELIKEWLGIEEEGAEAARMKKGPGAPKQPHEEMDHWADGRKNHPGDDKYIDQRKELPKDDLNKQEPARKKNEGNIKKNESHVSEHIIDQKGQIRVIVDGNEVPIYRGGNSFNVRPEDLKLNKDGLVKTNFGLSLDTNPQADAIIRYGGPYEITYIPDELKIMQRGAGQRTLR
jgi:hypothetical protein